MTTLPVLTPLVSPEDTGSPRFAMVQHVLERDHQLKRAEFLRADRLLQSQVSQNPTRPLDDAPSRVSETARYCGRNRERSGIEPLSSRCEDCWESR